MKASLRISRSHLRNLLRCIDKINSVPDEDIHADVHLKAEDGLIQLYSHVSPAFVVHEIEDGSEISVDVETPGDISFNIETLSNIVQKAEDGMFGIEFTSNAYHIVTPSGESLSSVEFDLPRHADSVFEEPLDIGELYEIDTISRTELRSGLSTMGVIGEFVNISVNDEDTVSFSVHNKVTGDANFEKSNSTSEISTMSQFYLIKPMDEFTSTLVDTDNITILVSERGNICLRAAIDSWTAEVHLSNKLATDVDSYLNL
jgi:hypothetical protein